MPFFQSDMLKISRVSIAGHSFARRFEDYLKTPAGKGHIGLEDCDLYFLYENGASTQRLWDLTQKQYESLRADVIVMLIGDNDVYDHTNPNGLAVTLYDRALETQKKTGARAVIMAPIFPRFSCKYGTVEIYNQRATQVNALLHAKCEALRERGEDVVGMLNQPFKFIPMDDPNVDHMRRFFHSDGVHLSPDGNKMLRRAIRATILRYRHGWTSF